MTDTIDRDLVVDARERVRKLERDSRTLKPRSPKAYGYRQGLGDALGLACMFFDLLLGEAFSGDVADSVLDILET